MVCRIQIFGGKGGKIGPSQPLPHKVARRMRARMEEDVRNKVGTFYTRKEDLVGASGDT